MADATYQPKVYRAQGGAEIVVTSSGTLTLEGTMTATGTVDISGATYKIPARAAAAANKATALPKFGHVVVTGSSTAPVFTLPAPVANGGLLSIHCKSIGASGSAIIHSTAHITSGKNRLKMDAIDEAVVLGQSSTGWAIVSNVGSVATTSG